MSKERYKGRLSTSQPSFRNSSACSNVRRVRRPLPLFDPMNLPVLSL